MSEVCQYCPYKASYEVAGQTTEENPDFYRSNQQSAAAGGIALVKQQHESMAEKLDCKEPTTNANGQLVCPLEDATTTAYNMAKGPGSKLQHEMNYETFNTDQSGKDSKSRGQYL